MIARRGFDRRATVAVGRAVAVGPERVANLGRVTMRSSALPRTVAIASFSCPAPPGGVHTRLTMGHLPRTHSSESVLPVAIARPHEAAEYRTAMLGSLDRWAQQRWRFIAPRLVPAVLAFIGMLGVLAAMDLMASRCHFAPQRNTTIYLIGDVHAASSLLRVRRDWTDPLVSPTERR
jgi:hypothetical protein